MIKTSKGIRDDTINLSTFYAVVGVVVAFTAATALLILYNNTSPSFDYRAFAQEEDNETTTTADNTTTTNLTSSNSTLIDFVSNIEQIRLIWMLP
jgi:hypothetical protein